MRQWYVTELIIPQLAAVPKRILRFRKIETLEQTTTKFVTVSVIRHHRPNLVKKYIYGVGPISGQLGEMSLSCNFQQT